jgi:hypothetical protein
VLGMYLRILVFVLFVLLGRNAFAEAFPLSDSTTFEAFERDLPTPKLKPTKALKNALCFGDNTFGNEVNKLLTAVTAFEREVNHTFYLLENSMDPNIRNAFQNLQNAYAADDYHAVLKAIRKFGDEYAKSYEEELQGHDAYTFMHKMLVKYGSDNLIRKIVNESRGPNGSRDYFVGRFAHEIHRIAHLIDPRMLGEILDKDASYTGLTGTTEVSQRHIFDSLSPQQHPNDSVILAQLRIIASNVSVAKAILQVKPEILHTSQHNVIVFNDILLQELLLFALNPVDFVCNGVIENQDTKSNVLSWCHHNDDAFLLALERIANHANDTSDSMKRGSIDATLVTNYVGINGSACNLRGSYYLLRNDKNEVIMYTSGRLEIARSGAKEKAYFEPFDLELVLSSPQSHFESEKERQFQ